MRSDNSASVLAVRQEAHRPEDERGQRRRYHPTAAYLLAERVKREGVELSTVEGPWRASGRRLRRPGRNNLGVIPLVTNGYTEVMVDTLEHAADLSGFLNWCGVEDLSPVPDLTPPSKESLGLH